MPRKRKPAALSVERELRELWQAVCALEGDAFAAQIQRTADGRAFVAILSAFAEALGKSALTISVPGRGRLPVAVAVEEIRNRELLSVLALTDSQAPAIRALRAQAQSSAKEWAAAEQMVRGALRAACERQRRHRKRVAR